MAKKVYISEEQFERLQNIIKEAEDDKADIPLLPDTSKYPKPNEKTPITSNDARKFALDLKQNSPQIAQAIKGGTADVTMPYGKPTPEVEDVLANEFSIEPNKLSFSNQNSNENRIFTKKMVEESRINKIIFEGERFSKKEFNEIILK